MFFATYYKYFRSMLNKHQPSLKIFITGRLKSELHLVYLVFLNFQPLKICPVLKLDDN